MSDDNSSSAVYLSRTTTDRLKAIRSQLGEMLDGADIHVLEEPNYSRGYRTFLQDTYKRLGEASCYVTIYDESLPEIPDSQVRGVLERLLRREGRPIPEGLIHGLNGDLPYLNYAQWEIILAIHRGLPVYVYSLTKNAFCDRLIHTPNKACVVRIDDSDEAMLFRCVRDLGAEMDRSGYQQQAGLLYRHCLSFYNDSDTLAVANDLGVALTSGHLYDEAEQLFRQSWELKKRDPGDDHPSTLDTLNNLCDVLRMKGDYPEAARLTEQCYQNRRRVLGGSHIDTLDSLNDSALLMDSQRAEARLRYGLRIAEDTYGIDDPITLRTKHNLAAVLKSRGDYREAQTLLRDLHGPEYQLWGPAKPSYYDARPFFTVGITGHMHISPESEEVLKKRIREVFRWLRDTHVGDDRPGFGKPLGFEKTPIVLLSSLAPGADQLAAEVALDEGINVRCPLPFPHEVYRQASSFTEGPVAAAISRQGTFDTLVQRIGVENTFLVTHADDSREYQPYLEDQLADKEFRNRRYRAAGEYVAANCDLLIAICDQEEALEEPYLNPELSPIAQSGSRIIISSYINGIEPGILPLPPSLSWQENGPVVRIFSRNEKHPRPSRHGVGDIRIWHPADAADEGKFHDQIHEHEMGELRTLADRLEKLNTDLDRCPKIEFAPEKMYKAGPTYRPHNAWDRLVGMGKVFDIAGFWSERVRRAAAFFPAFRNTDADKPLPPLRRLVSFKSRVEHAFTRYDRQVAFLTNAPFVMGLLVFLIYEFHHSLQDLTLDYRRLWAVSSFLLGGLLLLLGVWFHTWAKSWGAFDRKNDYRALIEGTRVQFFWLAAGIKEAVPNHYIQRLSGELAWIKSSLGSLTMPVERAATDFYQLNGHAEQCARLRDVWRGWVKNEENFFAEDSHYHSRLNATGALWGNLFLSAAAFMIFITFAHSWLDGRPVYRWLMSAFEWMQHYGLMVWALSACILWGAHQVIVSGVHAALYETKAPDDYVTALRVWNRIDRRPVRIILGLLLGLVSYSAIHSLVPPHAPGVVPQMVDGYIEVDVMHEIAVDFVRNLFVTLGGLFLGYALVKFSSENSRRYTAMLGQFRSARKKIDRLLKRYESLIEQSAVCTDRAEKIAIEKRMMRTQKAIQDLYLILGKEALHEHTEWLLMRRNRPVEPVSPIGG